MQQYGGSAGAPVSKLLVPDRADSAAFDVEGTTAVRLRVFTHAKYRMSQTFLGSSRFALRLRTKATFIVDIIALAVRQDRCFGVK